jgi:hypothetical protein
VYARLQKEFDRLSQAKGASSVDDAPAVRTDPVDVQSLPLLAPMAVGLVLSVSSEPSSVSSSSSLLSLQIKTAKSEKAQKGQKTRKPRSARRSPKVRVNRSKKASVQSGVGTRAMRSFMSAGGGQPAGEEGHPQVVLDVADELGFSSPPSFLEPERFLNPNPTFTVEPTNREFEAPHFFVAADFNFGPGEDEEGRRKRWEPLRLSREAQDGKPTARARLKPEAKVVDRQALDERRAKDLDQLQHSTIDPKRLQRLETAVFGDVERYALAQGIDALTDKDGMTVLNRSRLEIELK